MDCGEKLMLRIGDLIRFINEPWGVGIILEKRSIGGFHAYFPQERDWFAICSDDFESQVVEVISSTESLNKS